jgi:hypothetical protein
MVPKRAPTGYAVIPYWWRMFFATRRGPTDLWPALWTILT